MIQALREDARLRRWALLAPAMLFIGFFMLAPIGLMAYVSVLERGEFGGVEWGVFSIDAYWSFFFERELDGSVVVNTDYLQIFLRSFWLSLITTLLALLVGFPTALYMALQPERYRNFLVFLVTIPFWTNLLVRNYAWILLLRNNGLIDASLNKLGITSEPINVLYTPFATGIGLTYSFLPFMVLPIWINRRGPGRYWSPGTSHWAGSAISAARARKYGPAHGMRVTCVSSKPEPRDTLTRRTSIYCPKSIFVHSTWSISASRRTRNATPNSR